MIQLHVDRCVGTTSTKYSEDDQKTIPEFFKASTRESSKECERLLEMFSNSSKDEVLAALASTPTYQDAVEILMSKVDKPDQDLSALELIKRFRKNHSIEGHYTLEIQDRENIWREGLGFYKMAIVKPEYLFKSFHLVYEGELGIDAGALRIEFFTKFFQQARKELFEEVNSHVIPKRSGGNLVIFKIIGLVIAHSIFQDGPPFSSLAPWCYSVLLEDSEDETDLLLTSDEIPLNAGTATLIKFINELDSAKDNEEINSLFNSEEGPAYEQILNNSQWEITKEPTTKNREALLQLLIHEELIGKRERQLKSLREGLKIMKLYDTIKCSKLKFYDTFVSVQYIITAQSLLDIMVFDIKDFCVKKLSILSQFKNFVSNCSNSTACLLLKFITSYDKFPTMTQLEIWIDFMEPGEGIFIKAAACITTIRLPTAEVAEGEFEANILKALEFESEGFHDY